MKDTLEELKLISGEKEYSAKIDKNNLSKIFVDGEVYDIKVLKEYPNDVYALSVNNKIFTIKANQNGKNNIEILTTGFIYDFEVKTSTSALLEKFVKQSGTGKQKVNGIVAPMPGMVVKLNCAVGDEVSLNDKLIIVEAMKMENALSSPLSGKVTKINAQEGKPVDKGAVLIEIS